jgi:hypothetical protein
MAIFEIERWKSARSESAFSPAVAAKLVFGIANAS